MRGRENALPAASRMGSALGIASRGARWYSGRMPLWSGVAVFLLGLAAARPLAAESLYVFFPTTVRPHVLQKGLSGSGLDVIAFGRFADFEDKARSAPPDAILTLPEVVANMEGYQVAVPGRHNGESREPYFLMSLEKAMDPSSIAGNTIGIVDFLGRKGMQKFMAGIFQPAPTVKTVTKVEDLLPLITFKMADGILVTQAQAEYFRSISNLKFVLTPVPMAKAGTICLAVRKGAEAPKSIRTLKAMDAELRKLLGDVRWE